MKRPEIQTERLILRPFRLEDATEVARLADNIAVSRYIPAIPHPYPRRAAVEWLSTHQEKFDNGKEVIFAITGRADGCLMGAIGLILTMEHNRAEIGYWLHPDFWGKDYMTEAARAVLGFGFGPLNLETILGHHLRPNTASGKVMQKLGMKYEGCRRKYYYHRGEYFDAVMYGILKQEFND